MIELRNIDKSFGEKRVLPDVSLTLPEGSVTALMGASGRGKTTLLRILLGLETADSGEVRGMENVRVSAVFQEDRLLPRLTAEGNLRFIGGRDIPVLLAELGLAGETEPVSDFSGGMKRRVAIARALSAAFDLLVLDEPFRGLDEVAKEKAIALVKRYSEGKTVLLVTHDAAEAEAMDARLIEL